MELLPGFLHAHQHDVEAVEQVHQVLPLVGHGGQLVLVAAEGLHNDLNAVALIELADCR